MDASWIIVNYDKQEYIDPDYFSKDSEYIYWCASPLMFLALNILVTRREDLYKDWDLRSVSGESDEMVGRWYGDKVINTSSRGSLDTRLITVQFFDSYKRKVDTEGILANGYELAIELEWSDISERVKSFIKKVMRKDEIEALIRGFNEVVQDFYSR